ncbi:MAG: hypothetical protein JXB00_15640 [Bacteroidales bacterium]|nr:hypothetical protein [Bacteroidales bacterium]
MLRKFKLKEIPILLILLIVPILLTLIGFHLRSINGPHYLRSFDPEYSYLISGVSLAYLKSDLFMGHPGTPLHILIAVIIRIVHLFRPGNSLMEDVLENPEIYLHVIDIVIALFAALVMLFVGYIIYRKTGNIAAAVFIQFSPFVSQQVFTIFERTMPEPLFIPLILLLITLLVLDIENKLPKSGILKRKFLIYGIICGLCLALKFIFLPFLIIPLFLLSSIKEKFKYLITTVVAFFVFAFPVLLNMKTFYEWIKSIFMHSGKYGSGEENIIDFQVFILNIKTMDQYIHYFFIVLLVSLLVFLVCQIPFVKNKIQNREYLKLLFAVILVMMFSLLLIAKHFASQYLIPVLMLTVFACFLNIRIVKSVLFPKIGLIEPLIYLTIILLFTFSPVGFRQYVEYNKLRQQSAVAKSNLLEIVNDHNIGSPMVICSGIWNVRPEVALWFGKVMSPGNNFFAPALNKLYPNTFFYKEVWKVFFDWENNALELDKILGKFDKFDIVLCHYDENIRSELLSVLGSREDYKLDLLYSDESLHTYIYHYCKSDKNSD